MENIPASKNIAQEPLVSVIIPIYNVAPYLSDCLQSVVTQSYKKIEIILVDDGSTDESAQIVDDFGSRDARIYCIHIANQGVSHARNLGLTVSRGGVFCFIDGDDAVEPDYVESMLSAMGRTHADLVANAANPKIMADEELWSLSDLRERMVIREVPWDKLFRRDILMQTGAEFPEGLANDEDAVFLYRYLRGCKNICFIRKSHYQYRSRQGSAARSFNSDFWRCRSAMTDAFADFYESLETMTLNLKNAIIVSFVCDSFSFIYNYYSTYYSGKTKRGSSLVIAALRSYWERQHTRLNLASSTDILPTGYRKFITYHSYELRTGRLSLFFWKSRLIAWLRSLFSRT